MNVDVFEAICRASWDQINTSDWDKWTYATPNDRTSWQESVAAVLSAAGFRV